MIVPTASRVLLLSVLVAASSAAQEKSASLSAIQIRPQDALGRNIGTSVGIAGTYAIRIGTNGVFSIRADVGVTSYDDESHKARFGGDIGGRVQVNVKTDNYILPMSLSAEAARPTGIIRPYVSAGAGATAFFTESRIESTTDQQAIAATSNHSDAAASWVAGGGVYISIRSVALDIGVHYVGGGKSDYLARGSIVDLPNGEIKISPLHGTTNFTMLRVGTRFTL
ncbi:MAG: outer membrane beta-barrel protein [Gemmatimonadaceae bacterium]